MTQNEREQERDELGLEPETIKDLDVDEEDADGVRGGLMCSHTTMSLKNE